ncbi:MAG: MFS transporter [Candidatus Bathyarchaeota archaeon]|nr:MFS transporter [Candidatus Bathyarchaeota archaeon]
MQKLQSWIHHPLFLICLAQFSVFFGMSLVNPVLPLYIASFTTSFTMVGLVLSSFGISRIFIEIPGGRLMDRVGRKPVIIVGHALVAASHVLAGVAQSSIELVMSRMLLGIGSALILSASRIYVLEISTKDQRLRNISLFQGVSSIAGIVGPTMGGLIADLIGIRYNFFFSSVLSVIGVLLVINLKSHASKAYVTKRAHSRRPSLLESIKDLRIIAISAACFMIFFFYSSIKGTLLPLYGNEVLGLSSFEIGLVFSFLSMITVVGLLFFTHQWEARLSRAMLLPLSLCLCALAIVLVSFAVDLLTLTVFIIPLGVGLSILQPTPWTMISDYAHPEYRGVTMGVARTIADVGHLIGPIMVGWLIDRGQPLIAFYIVAGILGGVAFLTFKIFKQDTRS